MKSHIVLPSLHFIKRLTIRLSSVFFLEHFHVLMKVVSQNIIFVEGHVVDFVEECGKLNLNEASGKVEWIKT